MLHHAHLVTKGGKETFAAVAKFFSKSMKADIGSSVEGIPHPDIVCLLSAWIFFWIELLSHDIK